MDTKKQRNCSRTKNQTTIDANSDNRYRCISLSIAITDTSSFCSCHFYACHNYIQAFALLKLNRPLSA